MEEAVPVSNTENRRVETVIVPPKRENTEIPSEPIQNVTQSIVTPSETEAPEQETLSEESAPVNPNYAWPISGEVSRFHDADKLTYDPTMLDWRTHEGVDILAPVGETVTAAHAGRVESVRRDDLFGTVVTVSHGDGVCTVYANLAEDVAVSTGDWVEPGSVIGAIGETALCEVNQESHLHFAVVVNGVDRNPLDYLPA
jgi:murein DD-endopeptidase MepM/ murein hydrolase activator NlpD